jgi:hypothetical protein
MMFNSCKLIKSTIKIENEFTSKNIMFQPPFSRKTKHLTILGRNLSRFVERWIGYTLHFLLIDLIC